MSTGTMDTLLFQSDHESLANGPLAALRAEAFTRFSELGWPTTRSEAWRYTNLKALIATEMTTAPMAEVDQATIAPFLIEGAEVHRVVFVNGRFDDRLSSIGDLPAGVTVCHLADAMANDADAVLPHLGSTFDWKDDALTALNTAFIEDGLYIHVPEHTELDRPVHVLHVTVTDPAVTVVTHPRTLIVVGDGSRATCIESCFGTGDATCLVNPVTEIIAGHGAHVDHYREVREGEKTWHLGTLGVIQGNDGQVNSCCLALDGKVIRNAMTSTLEGTNAMANLRGLAWGTGDRHIDNFLRVNHMKPDCNSREYFKYVMDDSATATFTGRIYVELDAQKTDAVQTNRNLLLNDKAKVYTRPQLEIFADDVKCTHGATIGRIDEDARFYLQARGIGHDAARSLLVFAFANEIIEDIAFEPLRARLESILLDRLPDGGMFR
jgi:Fe-S cluster assembly protein SufD